MRLAPPSRFLKRNRLSTDQARQYVRGKPGGVATASQIVQSFFTPASAEDRENSICVARIAHTVAATAFCLPPPTEKFGRVGFILFIGVFDATERIKMDDRTLYTVAVILMSGASVLTGVAAALWIL